MAIDLTPAEVRFVRALCGSGPLGIAPLGLARVLGVTTSTIGNLSAIVERKGFCTRERYGMRVFLRPTTAALALNVSDAGEPAIGASQSESQAQKKTRTPRVGRLRST